MSHLLLDDAIISEGGVVTAENCPAVIPTDHYASIILSISNIGVHFDNILKLYGSGKQWGAIVLTLSTSYTCKVRPVENNGFVILVPVGMVARIRVLSRILLSYWRLDFFPRIIRSPLDNVPGDSEAIPPLLRPLFLEEEQTDFWAKLSDLDQTITLEALFENDVRNLVHLALAFMLSHEFTHILHGHFDLLQQTPSETSALTPAEIRRGIELDADDGAAHYTMLILKDDIDQAVASGKDHSLELGWLRLSYAVTMVFAISDTHRKYFGFYDAGSYNHPMVRCELFFQSAVRCLAGSSEEAIECWNSISRDGWQRCVMALENLTLDVLSGKFGKLAEGVQPAPIHTLNYSSTPGGITNWETFNKCKDALILLRKVRALLPIFAKIYAEGAAAEEIEDVGVPVDLDKHGETHPKAANIIGVFGLALEEIEALRARFGVERVLVYVAPEPPLDIENKGDGTIIPYEIAEYNFLDMLNHIILRLDDLSSISFFTLCMAWLYKNKIDTLICITDRASESNMRYMYNQGASLTGDATTEQWESEGKLVFIREFDLAALEKKWADIG